MFCCCSSKGRGPGRKAAQADQKTLQAEKEKLPIVSGPGIAPKKPDDAPLDKQVEIGNVGKLMTHSSDKVESPNRERPIDEMANPTHVSTGIESPQLLVPLSVNRENRISKTPNQFEIDTKFVLSLGISSAERLANQTMNRYNEEAMLEEFNCNINSPELGSGANLPPPGSLTLDNPLVKRSLVATTEGSSLSIAKDRKRKAIKNRLSTIKSLFCKEIISDIIYDNKEKEISKTTTIPRSLFMLRGKAIMKHLFSFLEPSEKVDLLLAIKNKVISNKDSNLLFLCLVKAGLAYEVPKLLKPVQWKDLSTDKMNKLVSSNLNDDSFLRYISLFIDFSSIQVEETYERCLRKPVCKVGEIDKDIPRTFPDYYCTTKRRTVLKEVLITLSTSSPTIGYVQGINAITGAIMIYLETQRMSGFIDSDAKVLQHLTFTIVKFMLERRSLSLMYERSLYGFSLLCLEIKLWVKVLHPDLFRYLVR